jgi:prepilin-type N-terminal cleavage/methylation domain-containing protein
MYNFSVWGYVMKNRGFSLIEMLFTIGLSGVILVSAMTLMLSFAHIHMSSTGFMAQIERDIFAKKLIKMLFEQYKFSEVCDRVDENLFPPGIFWESSSVPIFVCEYQEERMLVGIVKDRDKLKFIWQPKDSTDPKHLTLFNGVRRVRILNYDIGNDLWREHEFSNAAVRNALAEYPVCCLDIKCSGGKRVTIPILRE